MKMKIEMMEMETEILFGLFLIDSNLVLRQETGGSRNRNAIPTGFLLRTDVFLPIPAPHDVSVWFIRKNVAFLE
jgi:hypothetical protein